MLSNASLENEPIILTDTRAIHRAAPELKQASEGSRVLKLKVAVHHIIDVMWTAAAKTARLMPGSWRLLGLPRSRMRYVPKSMAAVREHLDWMQRLKGPYCEVIQQPMAVSRRAPKCAVTTQKHRGFTIERHHVHNELFLARMPGARVVGPNGVVITSNGAAVEESTWGRGWLEKDRVFRSCRLPKASKMSGHFYTIACLSSEGYSHWILDALTRLFAIDRTPLDEINLIVSKPLNRWQKESLAMLGLGEVNIVALENRSIEAEVLYMPSFAGSSGNPHPHGCQWLRERLVKTSSVRRRLYISRRLAQRRRIINEDELEPILADHGFEIIEAETMSFAEQLKLFSEAEVIVGPHGAGLTNLLFAPRGCKVLEVFDPNHVKVLYYALADVLEQPYWYIIGNATESAAHHGVSGHDDIHVSPSDFARSLDAMLKAEGN